MTEPVTSAAQAKVASPRRSRRALEQAAGSASSLLLMLILLMLNYLAFRHYRRIDWTSEGMFTLSPKSVKVVSGLQQDVDIYLFLSQGESAFDTTDELIKRYKAISEHVKSHYVDPDRQPGEFKILSQRFGVLEGVTEQGDTRADVAAIVAINGGSNDKSGKGGGGQKNWHVNREDLSGWDSGAPGEQSEQLNVKAEQALTGAIVQVTSGRPTKVCVTQGHDEWSLDESAERSLASLKSGLHHDNIEWEAFETLGKKEVPKGCDALFVIGPQRAFSESEAKLVLDYVQKGGNALLALDPVIEHDQILPTGFEEPLKNVGVRIDRSLAIELDPEHLLSPNTVEFAVTGFGDHATTRALKNRARVVVALARSLSVVTPSEDIEVLLRTSDKAFGATDITQVMAAGKEPTRGSGDIAGPIDLGFAVQTHGGGAAQHKQGGRLIVLGDSDFLQAPLLQAPELANFHLASAFTGWLTAREALIEIPPKKVKGGTVMFTQEDLSALLFRVGVLLPGAALLLGIAVWFNRRS
jgi:ABC-2 type transport system permease protein